MDSTTDKPLDGYRALVTGGSRGIGAACTVELARLGAEVVFTYRTSHDEAAQVARACAQFGVEAHPVRADLATDRPGREVVEAAAAVSDRFDIVVANAAAGFPRVPLPQIDIDELADKARTDVTALHRLCRAYGPGMAERGFGRFLAITSGASWGPTAPGLAAHGISKAAQEAYVRYAATELLGGNVTINALQLGFVATDGSSTVPETARRLLTAATPAGHLGQPTDIAGVVGLLAQPAAGWITGTTIPVTGGLNYPLNLAALVPALH